MEIHKIDEHLVSKLVIIRGAGDLASGIAIGLHRASFNILMTESDQPKAIRRGVSFAQAVYDGEKRISGIKARLNADLSSAIKTMEHGQIAVMIKPQIEDLLELAPIALVDGRMTKQAESYNLQQWKFLVGIGPGFEVGNNCHVVVETNRGEALGKLLYSGSAQPDTGEPGEQMGKTWERVFFAPVSGKFEALSKIGDLLEEGQLIGRMEDKEIKARFRGILRGILKDGLEVEAGTKLADVDPREERSLAFEPSDKALLIGQSVVSAVLENESYGSPESMAQVVLNFGEKSIALVGAGGKTTALGVLARKLPGKVILSTSTKLGKAQSNLAERHIVVQPRQSLQLDQLFEKEKSILLTGPLEGDKWTALQPEQISSLESFSRDKNIWVLIEADGSKRRPLKAPAAWEPVIPSWTGLTLVLVGLSAVGKPFGDDFVHRPEAVAQITGLKQDDLITMDSVIKVLCSANGGLKGIPPSSKKMAALNQLDKYPLSQAQRRLVTSQLHQAGYDFVWFGSLRPLSESQSERDHLNSDYENLA
ncbi:MAG TPA: selenium-dependent molybdenum cofactor biosynthesis protein YqeB [Anaerolineaceae bacterium]|nr:selenium-dependent molybdenum cofactor biosynthesis protein YqeB [Anaerolineaceae bacterium]